MNNFYIYFHINPLKNEIFYVGKGKGKRAFEKGSRRSDYWNRVVKKYGYIVDIIEEDLSEQEAFEREIFYINKIGRKDLGLGPLINMTNGGDGNSGLIFTEKHKLKLSESHKGNLHSDETKRKMSEIKKNISDETKRKMSEAQKGNKNCVGRVVSDETKRKMSESHKGNLHSEESKRKISESRKGKKRGPYKKNKNIK